MISSDKVIINNTKVLKEKHMVALILNILI